MGKKERTKPRTKPTAGGIWQCAGLAAAAAALAAAALRLAAPAGPQALAPQREYLEGLVSEIRTLQRARGTIQQAVADVGRDGAGKWLLFDEYHSRNVTAAFAELEWE